MKVLYRGKPEWPNGQAIPQATRVYKDAVGNDYIEHVDGVKHSVNVLVAADHVDIKDVRWTIYPDKK